MRKINSAFAISVYTLWENALAESRRFLSTPEGATIDGMFWIQLALFGIRMLEILFFAGLAGSAVVVVISFVEDSQELFSKE